MCVCQAPHWAAKVRACLAGASIAMSSSGEAAAFDDEWRRETSRFRQQRPLEFRRHEGSAGGGRRAEGPPRLAIQGPEDSPSRQSRRYDW